MKLLLVSLAASATLAYEISSNGCQCQDGCRYGQLDLFEAGNKFCRVGAECLERDSDSDDTCTSAGWAVTAANSVGNFFVSFFSQGQEAFGKLHAWSAENFKTIPVDYFVDNIADLQDELGKVSPEQLKDVALGQITAVGWSTLDLAAVAQWTDAKVAEIDLETFAQFSRDQLGRLPVDKITALTLEQVQAIPWEQIGAFSQEQWGQIPAGDVAALGWEQLQQAPWQRFAEMSQEEFGKIPVGDVLRLTGEQVANLDAEVLAGAAQDYWNHVPVSTLAALTAEQINKAGVINLDAERIGQLTQQQWSAVPLDDVVSLSVTQLREVDYDTLATQLQGAWATIPVDSLVLLTAGQVRAIPSSAVQEWTQEQWGKVPVKELIMFKGEQLNQKAVLAKLSVDALAEFAKTGELDTSLLEEEAANLLLADLGLDDLSQLASSDAVSQGQGLVEKILAWEEAKEGRRTAVAVRDLLANTAGTTDVQLAAAEADVSIASALEASISAELVEAEYLEPEPTEVGGAAGAGSLLMPLATVAVAMALTLSA